MRQDRIKVLDCTLRDGGFCLEDIAKNDMTEEKFSDQDIKLLSAYLKDSKLDIVEIGSVEFTEEDKRGFAIYKNIDAISNMMPVGQENHQMYSVLYRGPDISLESIPRWNPSLCEINRVILRYSELQKSLDFCAGLSEKGYKVFVQPMLTMRYTYDELRLMIRAANEMNAYAVYFVDSYGYMQAEDIERLFRIYNEGLELSVRIGFHAHNNMNLAFANALTFIDQRSDREIIVDSCMLGMGQGAGNLQTEILADHMNRKYGKNYDYEAILKACEIVEQYLPNSMWGYSLTRLLPAIHKVAYKYSVDLRYHHGLTPVQLDRIFRNIPEDLRHRYTPENALKLLDLFQDC